MVRYQQLFEGSGGKIHIYFIEQMTHAKCMVADQTTTLLGSANMNQQATSELAELNIIVRNAQCKFTQELLTQLNKDMENSRQITSLEDIVYNPQKAYLEGVIGTFSGNNTPSAKSKNAMIPEKKIQMKQPRSTVEEAKVQFISFGG